MKSNLSRTYESRSPEYIAKGGNIVKSQALFALAWFHAVVQERRMYILQVWVCLYWGFDQHSSTLSHIMATVHLHVFSSPEHIVLRVSYCDRSLSVRPSVRACMREQLLKNSSPLKPPNRFQ